MLPNVTTINIAAANTTKLANQSTIVVANGTFALLTTVLDVQRRVVLSFGGDESANTFVINGTNAAGFSISETLTGTNGTTAVSNLDFKTVTFIKAIAQTAATVQAGTNSTASTMWNIMNWHVSPVNIEVSGLITSPATAVTWGAQYTYDDPNNLPAGAQYPQPFNHPTLQNLAVSQDGPINSPVTGVRFLITAGTGTLRGTVIQAGIRGS